MSDDRDIDSAIAMYRLQLVAEAELARGDLDEIEDHLRTLAAELRATGLGAAEAVAEAARRLGEPRSVAREHARVRTAFGAKLSRARAWSATALFGLILIGCATDLLPFDGLWRVTGIELGLGCLLAVALAARLSWARPIVLGGAAFFLLPAIMWRVISPGFGVLTLSCWAGLVAFLAPWRRGELTASGFALALQVWAFGAAVYALGFQISTPDGIHHASFGAIAAFAAAIVAVAGGVLRARWSAIASAGSALSLGAVLVELAPLHFRMSHADLFQVATVTLISSGAVAALTGTVIAWRGARSTFGNLRAILDRG